MRIATLASTIFFFFCISLSAQEKIQPLWYWGVYGGYSLNFHQADFVSLPTYPSCCLQYEDGMGSGIALGLQARFPLTNTLQLSLRMGAQDPSGILISQEDIGNQFIRNPNPPFDTISRPITVEHSINSSMLQLAFLPSLSYAFFADAYVDAGFMLAYMIQNNFVQKEEIIAPSNVTFLNGSGIRNEQKGIIPEQNPLQMGIHIGVHYDLPIARLSKLSPYILYTLPLTSVSSVHWKISSIQAGLSVSLPVLQSSQPHIINDTVYVRDTIVQERKGIITEQLSKEFSTEKFNEGVEDNGIQRNTYIVTEHYKKVMPFIEKESILAPTITAWSIDSDGSIVQSPRIRIEEIETSESFPLLTHIYFPEGSSDLASTSQHLLLPNQVARFDESSLPSSTLELYNHILNITAKRLLSDGTSIDIVGYSNMLQTDNPSTIGLARAKSIKDYFVNTWHIPEQRIHISGGSLPKQPSNVLTDYGKAENTRAEWTTPKQSIVMPIVKKSIEQKANPPSLEILPKIVSTNPLQSWDIAITQNNSIVKTFTGKGQLSDKPLRWNISDYTSIKTEEPLTITLTVEDSLNKRSSATQQLSIEQLTIKKKRETLLGDNIIERFSLILFDFNSSVIEKQNKSILQTVKSAIRANSKVKITGFTDISGDEAYNIDLSERRCKEVQKALGLLDSQVTLRPMGNKMLPFDNTLPQGRAYSRTVQIEVSTPK